jgi:hypothetical protein
MRWPGNRWNHGRGELRTSGAVETPVDSLANDASGLIRTPPETVHTQALLLGLGLSQTPGTFDLLVRLAWRSLL